MTGLHAGAAAVVEVVQMPLAVGLRWSCKVSRAYLHLQRFTGATPLDQPCHAFCQVHVSILPTSELKSWCLMVKTELQARRTGHW